MAGQGQGVRNLDPGTKLVLEELRDLRLAMRADRRRAGEERRRADEELRRERMESNERFQQLLRDFRDDSARREAATQKAFKDIRTVGLSIVKTLNHHTRILERIDHKLGARGHWRRGRRPSKNDHQPSPDASFAARLLTRSAL
jgi:hypothetical protein